MAGGPAARGEEPVEAFLAALRERGYFDLAVEYLERLGTSSVISPEFQQTLAYQQGVTLVQASLTQRQSARKAQYLDRAQAEFERFREEQPDHSLLLSANAQVGKILVERGRLQLLRADRPGLDASQREQFIQQARELFGRARQMFEQSQAGIRRQLEQIPKALAAERDAALIKRRDQLRAEYVEAQFVAAMIRFEKAQTYAVDSDEARQALEAAEQAFGVVAEKYRRRVAGLSAVLFQGRCRQKLGDIKGALGFYEDLLTLPDDEPALRLLKTKALCQAIDCWLHPDVQQAELAIEKAEARLQQRRPDEQADSDWLTLQVRLAESYVSQASTAQSTRDKSRLLADARRMAVEVAKQPGETQQQAQELLTQLGYTTTVQTSQVDVTTFAEALEVGQEFLSQRHVAAGTISLLSRRIAQITDADQRQEAEARLQATQEQLRESDQKALQLFEQARLLADEETPPEQLNLVRFYLCSLHYYAKNYHEAAVLASFLSRHFPESAEGRRAGAVALASLVQLYGDGTSPSAGSLTDRIRQTAEDLARRFPGQPEAEDALATLVTLAVQAGRVDEAQQILQQLPEDSPRRGQVELVTGQALWNQSFSSPTDNNSAPATDQHDSLRQRAAALLTSGLQRSQDVPVTPTVVAAALSLAQHALQLGESARALELLEHATYGPLVLAERQDPLMQSAGLTERAYTLALLAYISELPKATAPDEIVTKVMTTLEVLKKTVGDDAAGRRQLSATYLSLAQNLRQQIEAAPPEGREALSAAFEQFLERAAASATEENVLSWVAESYVGLGRALSDADEGGGDEGKPYFAKAIALYQSILQRAAAGELSLDANARLTAESRLAAAHRQMGDFPAAVDQFSRILAAQPNQVYVQLEAARTLQQWGDHGQTEAYLKAIRGDRPAAPGQANLIWGFGRLARVVASSSSLRDLFHEARCGLAQCRFQYALQQPPEQRKTMLAEAERDIVITARLYPDLGGEQRKAEYDQLLQEIRRSQGKKHTGLE